MRKVTLRSYQQIGIDAVREAYGSGFNAPLFVMGTGGGKTVCFSYITQNAAEKGKRVLIIAHRRELLRQASSKLGDAGVSHGVIAPGFTPTKDLVQVASIQTVQNRLDKIGQFDLIVIDEGHHSVAGGYVKLIASQPNAKLLLVTATPERLDGKGLGLKSGGCCDTIVLGPQSGDLIRDGYLTPIRIFAPPKGPDLSGVSIRMGEYDKGEMEQIMAEPTIVGDAVEHYGIHSPGSPAVVFCVSIQHARDVAETFRTAGWRSVAADGKMKKDERDKAIGGLATGEVQVLCVCDLISEGLDIPGISTVIILRATKSLVNFLQWIGRGLRPVYVPGMPTETTEDRRASIAASPKPHCLVLDHAGCTLNHGMPDMDRDWSLEGRPKKQKAPPTKQCKNCGAIHAPSPVCPVCGYVYETEVKTDKELVQVAGYLTEITETEITRLKTAPLREILTGKETREQLLHIAKLRKYNPGWVHHVMRERAA